MRIQAGIWRNLGQAALLGLCLLATACASTKNPQTSSTAHFNPCLTDIADRIIVARDRGIGGTGISGDQTAQDRGIGGTGISTAWGEAETGFLGRITGFGSICVNGDEIAYGDDTPVTIDGTPASAADLKIGQVVAVTAQPSQAKFEAVSIAVEHPIIGPVAAYDAGAGRLTVLGHTVVVDEVTRKTDVTLEPGAWIAVSGLWRNDGVVMASRIDAAEPGNESVVRSDALPFGPDVKALSIETYAGIYLSDKDLSSGPPGTPEPGQATLPEDRPLIVRGTRDADGNFRYRSIWIVEDRPISRPPAIARPEDEPSRTIDRPSDIRPDTAPTDVRPERLDRMTRPTR